MNCIICNKELTEKQIKNFKYGKKKYPYCSKKCSDISPYRKQMISESLLGHTVSQETRNKISKSQIGKIIPEETRQRMNKDKIGKPRPDISKLMSEIKKGNNGLVGKKLSKQHKRNIAKTERFTMLKQIKKRLNNGEQLMPNWNPKACDYFEQFDLENNTQGLHARNGGEFYIKELGYWVDYINHDLKLIMEYDEKYHFTDKQKEKDMRRQEEIQELYPEYTFKRIQEVI